MIVNLTISSLSLITHTGYFFISPALFQKHQNTFSNIFTNRFIHHFAQFQFEGENKITKSYFSKYLSSVINLNSREWKSQLFSKTIDISKREDLTFVECTFQDIKSKGFGVIASELRSGVNIKFNLCTFDDIDSDNNGLFAGSCNSLAITNCIMNNVYSLNMHPLFSISISGGEENVLSGNQISNIGTNINLCHYYLFDFVSDKQNVFENNFTRIFSADSRCGGSHWSQNYKLQYNIYAHCRSSCLLSILPNGILNSYILYNCNLSNTFIETNGKLILKNCVFIIVSKALSITKEGSKMPVAALYTNCLFDQPLQNYQYSKDTVKVEDFQQISKPSVITFSIKEAPKYGIKVDPDYEEYIMNLPFGNDENQKEENKKDNPNNNKENQNGQNKVSSISRQKTEFNDNENKPVKAKRNIGTSISLGIFLGFSVCVIIFVVFWFLVIHSRPKFGVAASFNKSTMKNSKIEKLDSHPKFERTPSFDAFGNVSTSDSNDYSSNYDDEYYSD